MVLADLLTNLLWIILGLTIVAAPIVVLRWRRELSESGWWTGIVLEGRKFEVGVERDLCMGSASCVELAPEVFHLDWTKRKSVFDPAPLEKTDDMSVDPQRLFKAVQSCPYRAIFLRDAVTGERIFP